MLTDRDEATAMQILAWLEAILALDDGQVELRATEVDGKAKGHGGTFSRLYPRSRLADLAEQAVVLSGRAEAVYFTLNPIKPDVRGAVKASGISRRRRLLLDADPTRGEPGKVSATDAEKAHAVRLSGDTLAYLARLGWPAPARGDSGNGIHGLYAIDLPNDDESRELVRRVLAALAHRFDTADATIDTTVYDAGRICKLYGTLARKGAPTADRPHRASAILEIPPDFGRAVVTREMLEAVATLAPRPEPTAIPPEPPSAPPQPRPSSGRKWGIEDRAIAYLAKCPGGVAGNKGHNQTFKTACKVGPGFDLPPEVAFRLLRDHWNPTCDPPWSDDDLRRKVDEAFKKETRRGWLSESEPKPTPLTPLTPKGSSEGAFSVYGVNGVPQDSTHDPGDEVPIVARQWPEPPGPAAQHGLLGRIVGALAPHTEADPTGLAFAFLAAIGNMIGRTAHFTVAATPHYTNLFMVAVGRTSSGRKGTALDIVRRVMQEADEEWTRGRCVAGLVSGEGLIWGVRDPIRKREKVKTRGLPDRYDEVETDPGVEDKRLFVIESEFGGTLKVTTREGNTLSAVIRQAWDSGDIRSLAKNNPGQATGAHISIVGNITDGEVNRHLSDVEATNGFANRFLWVAVRRSQFLPDGSKIPDDLIKNLARELAEVKAWVDGRHIELARDHEARAIWHDAYERLSGDKVGQLGAVLGRGAPQVLRLAANFAVLDRSEVVRRAHVEAALALWGYCERSAAYIFGDSLGDKEADHLLDQLKAAPDGLTRSEIREQVYQRNKPASEIARILQRLLELNLVRSEKVATAGRPAERWCAVDRADEEATWTV